MDTLLLHTCASRVHLYLSSVRDLCLSNQSNICWTGKENSRITGLLYVNTTPATGLHRPEIPVMRKGPRKGISSWRFIKKAAQHDDVIKWKHVPEWLAICAGNSLVTGDFPTQRKVKRSFDVFFDLRLKKRLSKQWRGWWFGTPSRPLWRHCNVMFWHDIRCACNSEGSIKTWWLHDMEPLSIYLAFCGRWCFLWCYPEQAVEKTLEAPVVWDVITLTTSL